MERQLESIFDNHFDPAQFFENHSAISHDVGSTNPFDEFDIEHYALPEGNLHPERLPQRSVAQIPPESLAFSGEFSSGSGTLQSSHALTSVNPLGQQRLLDEKGLLSAVINTADLNHLNRGARVRSSASSNPYAMAPTGSFVVVRDSWDNFASPFSAKMGGASGSKSESHTVSGASSASVTMNDGLAPTGGTIVSQTHLGFEEELALQHFRERQKISSDIRLRQYFNLEPMTPLTLSGLPDPTPINTRPMASLEVLVGLAVLGSPEKRLLQSEIVDAIKQRFLWYRQNGAGRAPWIGSIKHMLSLKSIFQQVERPPTQPGRGHYWIVDIDEAEIQPNKRERKRNRISKKQLKAAAAAEAKLPPRSVTVPEDAEQKTENTDVNSTAHRGASVSQVQIISPDLVSLSLSEYDKSSVRISDDAPPTQNYATNVSRSNASTSGAPRSTYSSLSGALGQRSSQFLEGIRQAFHRRPKEGFRRNTSVQSLPQNLSSHPHYIPSVSSLFRSKKNSSSSSLAGALDDGSPYRYSTSPSVHGSNDSFIHSPPPSTACSSVVSLASTLDVNPPTIPKNSDMIRQPDCVRMSTGNLLLPRRSSYSSLAGALSFCPPIRRAPSPSLRGSQVTEVRAGPGQRRRRLSLEPGVQPPRAQNPQPEGLKSSAVSADPSMVSSGYPGSATNSRHSRSSYSSLRGAVDLSQSLPAHRTSSRPPTPMPGDNVRRIRVAVSPKGFVASSSNVSGLNKTTAKAKKMKAKKKSTQSSRPEK